MQYDIVIVEIFKYNSVQSSNSNAAVMENGYMIR